MASLLNSVLMLMGMIDQILFARFYSSIFNPFTVSCGNYFDSEAKLLFNQTIGLLGEVTFMYIFRSVVELQLVILCLYAHYTLLKRQIELPAMSYEAKKNRYTTQITIYR